MKRILSGILILVVAFSLAGCSLIPIDMLNGSKKDLSNFYDRVSKSQNLLDAVADDIYTNWHAAIYKDEFGEDINLAIAYAQIEHDEDLQMIKLLDKEITDLFKKVKDGKNSELVKDVMSAYSDYYELVVNVSGSFNSYSAQKETLKKELASTLKELSYEL